MTQKSYLPVRKGKNDKAIQEGKMPPQAVELEEAVLGAIMLEREARVVLDLLIPASFYKDAHGRIYNAILKLNSQSYPIDILTVSDELKRSGELELVGGRYFITELTSRVASSANVEFHARIIAQKYLQRELIRIATQTINDSYDDSTDVFDTLDSLEKNLTAITTGVLEGKRTKTMAELWNQICKKNLILLQNKGMSGVPTGLPSLDKITGGWQPGNLIIIAGRPKMGKTALAMNLTRNAAVMFNKRVAFFSLEMQDMELGYRVFASEAQESITRLTKYGVGVDQLMDMETICEHLINSSIFIDDTPAMNIRQLRSKARKLKREKKIELIVVDYLQLMSGDDNSQRNSNREQEIAGISRGLKALAKELELPIIALSQLSRAVETRGGDKRPQLSDLRESGAIEQDADMVIFVHRPEYYGITEYGEHIEEIGGRDARGIAEIIISANRNGPVGPCYCRYIANQTKFVAIEEPTPEPNGSIESAIQPQRNFIKPGTQEDLPF